MSIKTKNIAFKTLLSVLVFLISHTGKTAPIVDNNAGFCFDEYSGFVRRFFDYEYDR